MSYHNKFAVISNYFTNFDTEHIQEEEYCNHRKCPKEGYKDDTWTKGAKLQREVKLKEIRSSNIVYRQIRGDMIELRSV